MTAADDRPIILIAPRLEQPKPCLQMPERLAPEETGSTVFLNAILAAGGLPLIMALTEDEDVIARYVEMADGVAIPGGQDVDPALWGEEEPYDERLLCHERDSFELKLIRAALRAHKPLFATCRGMQILNVALGGTLCMDVPSLPVPEGKVHWRHLPILNDPAHPIAVEDGSLLARVLDWPGEVQVNSSHHCCVDRLGDGVRLVAVATDGVPEAIEVEDERFCMGVQCIPSTPGSPYPPTSSSGALLCGRRVTSGELGRCWRKDAIEGIRSTRQESWMSFFVSKSEQGE